ncbi:MAG: TrkA family potassium uptake protein [candidate division Zixibacteria bacterium]|nr:TrkA family potassium uptake protein [candidate division Zixibacteria bacterium]
MRRFGVIGLGNFGYYIARTLAEEKTEVIAIDINPARVQKVSEFVDTAVVGDATDIELLKKLGLGDTEAVIVSTGDNIQYSILVTMFLKELGCPNVVAKAISEEHARVLERIGADKVIIPEKEMAIKSAKSLATPNMIDFVPLSKEYIVAEISPGDKMLGKSLAEVELRSKYNVQLLAIKEIIPDKLIFVPSPDYKFKDSDILLILGKKEDIERLRKE